jgi:hypothetical protein
MLTAHISDYPRRGPSCARADFSTHTAQGNQLVPIVEGEGYAVKDRVAAVSGPSRGATLHLDITA